MTTRKLSRYYYLCREIEQSKRDLAALEQQAAMVFDSDVLNLYEKSLFELIDKQKEAIRQTKLKVEAEKLEICAYINQIDDSLIRMIIKHRYIDRLSWQAVAFRVGGDNTADSVRKIAYRYIKKGG